MPTLYKIITAILAVIGCAGLTITGEVNPLMAVSGIALIPGYYRCLKGRPNAPAWAIGTFSILALLVFLFDTTVISGDIFIAVAHLTIAFQAIKSFDLKEPWDHLQVYFVSLLQMIIASEMTHSVAFGVVFILFMVLLVTAMVLSHFLKEGAQGRVGIAKPVVVISLLTLLTTALFFIVIPRTPFKFFGKSHMRGVKTVGFSDKVDFGTFSNVKLDPAVVMRIEMDRDIAAPHYWRGMTLDYFDGLSWRNSLKERYRVPRGEDEYLVSPYDRRSAVEQRIYLEPIDSDVIFGLGEIKGVRTDFFSVVQSDMAGDIYIRGKGPGSNRYTIHSVVLDRYHRKNDPSYLQLPRGLNRIANLAKKIAAGAVTDEQKAASVEEYLRKNYVYSLFISPPPVGMTQVEDFLFHSKKGYCEHYATSMVLMLRSLGVPSRMITGFYGGERNSYGGYIIVRQSDAHSWVEAFVKGVWRRYDPTPYSPAEHPSAIILFMDSIKMIWLRYVVGFSLTDQRNIFHALTMPFVLPDFHASFTMKDIRPLICITPFLILLVSLIFAVSRNLRSRRYGFVTGKYMAFRNLLKKKGLSISPSDTAGDIKRKIGRLKGGREADEFIKLYEVHRFGGKEMGPEDRKRYVMLLKEVGRR